MIVILKIILSYLIPPKQAANSNRFRDDWFLNQKNRRHEKEDHKLSHPLPQAPWEMPEVFLHWKLIAFDRHVQACLLQFPLSAHLLLNSIIMPPEPSLCFREKQNIYALIPKSSNLGDVSWLRAWGSDWAGSSLGRTITWVTGCPCPWLHSRPHLLFLW